MEMSYDNGQLLHLYYRLPIFARDRMADIYSLKQRRKRFGGAYASQFAELERNAPLSLAERTAEQLARLQNMLVYADAHVPYYHRLFEKVDFDPKAMRSIADLQRLPLLSKESVRQHFEDLVAQPAVKPIISSVTSGTTGTALRFILSEEANQRHYACLWFHYSWAGIQRGEPVATFGGHPVAALESQRPPFWQRDSLEHELMFSAYHVSPESLPHYVDALAGLKPALIRGYPSFIYLVALQLLDAGRKDVRPKGVFTYAETTLDSQRRVIEQAFDCPVYSSYGNGERVGHILQCREGNFHVVTETSVVEVLGPDGEPTAPGEVGELVITSLTNRAMPFIRYRVGDTGVMGQGPCPCGRTTPILSDLMGRVEDYIVTPEGRYLGRMDKVFYKTDRVKEAQLVQEQIDSLCVKIVPRPGFSAADRQLVLDELRHKLGSQINIDLQMVDQIPRTANGKFRLVVSRVPVQVRQAHLAGGEIEARRTSA